MLDTVIALKRPKDYKPEDGCSIEIHFEKSRNFSGEAAQSIQAKLIEIDSGFKWDYKRLEESTYEKAIALHKDGIKSISDIATELGVNKSTISRHLTKARQSGLVKDY